MNNRILILIGGILGVALLGWFVWYLLSPSAATNIGGSTTFSTSNTRSVGVNATPTYPTNIETRIVPTTEETRAQKIFPIATGPVVSATFIQTLRPTTTIARYIMQESGHVFDLALDVPGSAPRSISNVTIPGGQEALWLEQGDAVILRYIKDNTIIKSVYLGFPSTQNATSGVSAKPVRVQFLTDNIISIAASPDGKSVAYLIATKEGSDGYIANGNGTGSKKVFSLPFSQVTITWPAQTTMLVQTKNTVGAVSVLFSINTETGSVTPLISAQNLTALGSPNLTYLLHQSVKAGTNAPSTYVHIFKTDKEIPFVFNPSPEKCVWSRTITTRLFCAFPLTFAKADYLDMWHKGTVNEADSIVLFDLKTGLSIGAAVPGSAEGGIESDILSLALSPEDKYIGFVSKWDRALWGVRLVK